MKTVMAFIRINMMNTTKKALTAAGITSMTAEGHVQGRGRGYRFAQVLEHKAECRSGKRHGVCSVKNNKPIVGIVIIRNNLHNLGPRFRSHL